jgi:hypothetical protein
MGYSTRYTLEIQHYSGESDTPNCSHQIVPGARFCPVCGKPAGYHHIVDDILKEPFPDYADMNISDLVEENMDDMRWYEHTKDMQVLSKKYPGFLFILHGEGEQNDDIWTEYHLNGKVQVAKAKVVIAEFEESSLK